MKKRIVLCLGLIVALFIFIGCQSKIETEENLEPISLAQIELAELEGISREIDPLEKPTETEKPTEVEVEEAIETEVEIEEPQLTADEVVDKIMRGDLGNGAARVKAVEELGHDPVEIQEMVNERSPVLAPIQNSAPAPAQNSAPAPAPVQNSAPAQGNVVDIFYEICAEKGISQAEIDGWAYIIKRESNWNVLNVNSSSGAYGLPQALPGHKMASHGADWQTNPRTQLLWMYDYMLGRYGSIGGALDFWNANCWY